MELAERSSTGWTLTLRKIVPSDDRQSAKVYYWWQEEFDAIVIASGRYNAPHVPDTKGLWAWAKDTVKVIHSRQYRHPETYTNLTVLVVGASSSGIDISREIAPYVSTLYQSIRNLSNSEYLQTYGPGRLPINALVVPEVAEYLPDGSSVRLVNGTVVRGIDRVILGTGYTRTFPFLPSLHADKDAKYPVVTDGTHVQNLYLDTFYIPDPTLAFTNQNLRISGPFRFAEYQASAAAKVWSGTARLPSKSAQWKDYQFQHKDRVPGKEFNDLNSDGTNYLVRRFVGWLNYDASFLGGSQIDGYPANVWEETKNFFAATYVRAVPERNTTLSAFSLSDEAVAEGLGE